MTKKQLRLEGSARLLLSAFGRGNTPGLERTPERFASVFLEENGDDPEKVLRDGIIKEVRYSGMVVETGLSFFSLCEHHLLPFFGTASIGYIPDERVVGLSKLPRALRCLANGPRLQETITEELADLIEKVLEPKAVGVVLSATHLCMVARGVKIDDARTTTSVLRGLFLEPGSSARAEFLNLRRRDG